MYAGKPGKCDLLFLKNLQDYDEQDLGNKEILETSSMHKRN